MTGLRYYERKRSDMTKTPYMATIYDGHSHIERVVFTDDVGYRFVRINGFFFDIDFELKHYDVDVWYRG